MVSKKGSRKGSSKLLNKKGRPFIRRSKLFLAVAMFIEFFIIKNLDAFRIFKNFFFALLPKQLNHSKNKNNRNKSQDV